MKAARTAVMSGRSCALLVDRLFGWPFDGGYSATT
jgi:hypothetical protein